MAKLTLLTAAFAAALTLVSTSAAQNPTTPSQQDEQVIVTGQRTREAIANFVSQMSVAPPRYNNQLARWDVELCPGVIGLKTHYAQFVLDRVAYRAQGVGLDVGQPGCRANVMIAVTDDADAVAQDLFDHHKALLGYYQTRGHTILGRQQLARFVTSDAPVRWWHVSRVVTKDGDILGDTNDNSADRPPGQTLPNTGGAPITLLGAGHSRINQTTHQDFGVAFVIVDARQLGGASFEALADYIAMVTLAQLDPRANTASFPSILNLFSQPAPGMTRPTAMTDWDAAYLHGLYGATRDARNSQQQEGDISRTMASDLNVQ